MEAYLTVDLEKRIKLYEEEKKKIEEAIDQQFPEVSDDKGNSDDFNGYVADWYIE